MNRRRFLAAIGGTVAGVAVAVKATPTSRAPSREFVSMADVLRSDAEDFMYRGWHVLWRPWREPANQCLVFGFWAAFRHDGAMRYCTTMGSGLDYHAHELHVLDVTWREGWPSPVAMLTASAAERDAVKRRARNALLDALA